MAYSQDLAKRIEQILAQKRGIAQKKLFGCVAFLFHGNVFVGVWKNSLIVRLGPQQGQAALLEPHVREFDITGRPMKGWVVVDPAAILLEDDLADWIERSLQFAAKLPKK